MPKSWHDIRRSDGLGWQLVRLQNALADKAAYANRLEDLLRARSARIDELTGRLEQSQAQVRQLSEEADHLAELFKG